MRGSDSATCRIRRPLLLLLLCSPLLIGGYLIWHGIYIGFFAPRETLEVYQFGSECMGWRFRSRETYFLSGLIEGGLMLVAAGLLAWWLKRRPRR